MNKEIFRQIKQIMEVNLQTTKWEQGKSWNGFEVFVPIYDEDLTIGLTSVVLVKGDEVRCSTPEESLAYFEWKSVNN